MKIAEAALKEEQHQAIYRTVGRAYAILESDLPASENTMRARVPLLAIPLLAGSLTEAFRTRSRAAADRVVSDLIGKCKRHGFAPRDKSGLRALVEQGSANIHFASPETKSTGRPL